MHWQQAAGTWMCSVVGPVMRNFFALSRNVIPPRIITAARDPSKLSTNIRNKQFHHHPASLYCPHQRSCRSHTTASTMSTEEITHATIKGMIEISSSLPLCSLPRHASFGHQNKFLSTLYSFAEVPLSEDQVAWALLLRSESFSLYCVVWALFSGFSCCSGFCPGNDISWII